MKIKIDNRTDYDTKWLRKIFNRCLRMVNRRIRSKVENRDKRRWLWKSLKVEVVYKQSHISWAGGKAFYNLNYVHLSIPRPPEKMISDSLEKGKYRSWLWTGSKWERPSKAVAQKIKEHRKEVLKILPKAVARVFVHELYHCYGYHHEEMVSKRKKIQVENTYNYNWTEKYPVQMKEEKPKTPKPKKDLQLIRYENVLRKVKEYTSKIKRYQNILKKYKDKQKYYEKVLVAAGKIKID